MTAPASQVSVITGCSSGIGRAVALEMHRAGLTVYATARRQEDLAELAEVGIHTLRLDVTDEASMAATVEQVEAEQGRIDVLVNNAGTKLISSIEEATPESVRREFETNVLGMIRLTQLVLHGMRARGDGIIVNISSIFGRFSPPGGGYPAATKHALNAITDALRLEVAPFGIRVILIEPSGTRTKLTENALKAKLPDDGPYGKFNQDVARWNVEATSGPPYNFAGRFAPGPEKAARVITKAVTSPKPRSRYKIGPVVPLLFMLKRTLPDAGFDWLIRTTFPIPEPARTRDAASRDRTAVR